MMFLVIRILNLLDQDATLITFTTIFHMTYFLSQNTATLGGKEATPAFVGGIKTQPQN